MRCRTILLLIGVLIQGALYGQILLYGTLWDKTTNYPIQQATVKIQGGDQDVTNSDGEFKLDLSKTQPLPKPGDMLELQVQFTALNLDYKNRIIPITIPGNYNLRVVEIDKQYIYLYGKTVDATTGNPIEGITVFLTNREVQLPEKERSVLTGPLGYFEFKFYQSQIGDLQLFNADFVDRAGRYKGVESRLYLKEREVVKMEPLPNSKSITSNPKDPQADQGGQTGGKPRYRVVCRAGGYLSIVFSQPNKNSTSEPPIEECKEIEFERELDGWVKVKYTYNGRACTGWIQRTFLETY